MSGDRYGSLGMLSARSMLFAAMVMLVFANALGRGLCHIFSYWTDAPMKPERSHIWGVSILDILVS